MQNTQDQLHKKNQELVDLYRDKSKKFTQITNLYNILKSRAMRSQMQTAASDSVSRTLNSLAPLRTGPSTTAAAAAASKPVEGSDPPQTPRQQSMYPVSRDGVEQLHRYQRSGTGSSRGKQKRPEAAAMPPPSRPLGLGTIRNSKYSQSPGRWNGANVYSRGNAASDAACQRAASVDGAVAVPAADGPGDAGAVPGRGDTGIRASGRGPRGDCRAGDVAVWSIWAV